MEMIIVKRDSDEWNNMWERVSTHPINEGLPDTSVAMNEGQSWQYVGTYYNNGKAISSFRHRLHPKTGGLYNVSYEHKELREDQIQKKFKL